MLSALLHLFYPHSCESCGRDLSRNEEILCLRCYHRLPVTRYHLVPNNPVEKLFWGRVPVQHASAAYYFGKHSHLQHLIHSFKYLGRKDIAFFLGRQMGNMLMESGWLTDATSIVPVPLFKSREKKRGYNQAAVLASGISEVTGCRLRQDVLFRKTFTDTQTHKGRIDRWQNVSEVFYSRKNEGLEGEHVLLVDDVLTTGATMEACANSLAGIKDLKISVFGLAYTSV
ncbi:ComF family protein [uncultured Chitinophaga sp.]|uniref:ComF family protein n=1 Tax=uncultured Chitinophaga sp. TaxID=339340 RepID=UPI0025EBA2B8|nr:phosphoribosyltransferase family protein [uncultured Chitinophaga sp.]